MVGKLKLVIVRKELPPPTKLSELKLGTARTLQSEEFADGVEKALRGWAEKLEADIDGMKKIVAGRSRRGHSEERTEMARSRLQRIEEIAASAGFQKIWDRNNSRITWRLCCSNGGCAAKLEHGWQPSTSPDAMLTFIARQGWYADFGKEPLCPDHFHERKHATKVVKLTKPTLDALVEDLPEEVTVAEPNFRLTKNVMDLLDAYFELDKGLYKTGWSDQMVAQSSGAHINVVVKIRNDAFGELKEDPELSGLRGRASTLETQALNLMEKISEFGKAVDMYAAKKKVGG